LGVGGMLSNSINPEIAASHPNYGSDYYLLSLLKRISLWASEAAVAVLLLRLCLLVIRSKKRSPLYPQRRLCSLLGPWQRDQHHSRTGTARPRCFPNTTRCSFQPAQHIPTRPRSRVGSAYQFCVTTTEHRPARRPSSHVNHGMAIALMEHVIPIDILFDPE